MSKLYVVGVGSGNYEDMTIKAARILESVDAICSDSHIYKKLKFYFGNKMIGNDYKSTSARCNNAINSAESGLNVAITGSGDTGIYGISSIIIERVNDANVDVEVEVIPGITSAISGASLLGSPLTSDFAVISLSSNLSDLESMKKRIIATTRAGFIIVFYSPNNSEKSNLMYAKEILLSCLPHDTSVGIVSNIGDENQSIELIELQSLDVFNVCENSTVFVGNKETSFTKTKKMVTPLAH